jgi:hypothetical protein
MHHPVNNMRPVHPGEILREDFLIPLNMSANALALARIFALGGFSRSIFMQILS